MRRCTLKLLIPLLALCILGCGIGVPGAVAKPRPFVSLALTPAVNEGAPIPFTWNAKRLGPVYRLVIQKPVGTAKVWKTVMKLPTRSGSAELPGISPLGRYRYRIAAFRGQKFLAAQRVGVSVYGVVPFTTLFQNYSPKVFTTPTTTFPYVRELRVGNTNVVTMFQVKDNHCTSVHVAFAFGELESTEGTGTLTLVQESRNPVSSTVPFNGISSVEAELTPGQTWAVTVQRVLKESNYLGVDFFINGYAVCNSTKPFDD